MPAAKIYEDKILLIFLDRRPLFLGHCLLVPKKHFVTLNDLPKNWVAPFFTKLQDITKIVQVAMSAEGTFVAMNNFVSQSVPHFHVHIVPRCKGDGLKGFFWPRQNYSEDQLAITQEKLQKTWHEMLG